MGDRSLLNFPSRDENFFIPSTRLSKESLKQKARHELNEIPEQVSHELDCLRQLISEETSLHANTNDNFLIRFLRSRKYDRQKAFKLVKSYYRAKVNYPTIYKTLVPSDVADVLESGMFTMLPGLDSKGRAISWFRFEYWDTTKISAEQFLRAIIMTCENLLEDDDLQISGTVAIVDLGAFSFQHLRQITPAFAYRSFSFLQDWSPIRFQGFYFVRENALFDIAFAILSPFIKSKLRERIHFLGHDVTTLLNHFPPEVLPEELGGTYESKDENIRWLRYMLAREDYFKCNNETYGYKA